MTTAPKPFVFVLMPFDEGLHDVYALGIRPACERAGAYTERVDEQVFRETIIQRIYNQIAKADLVVADMTGRNPNVFYEVGYAHALGKPVVLLTQRAEDIPFDLKHYPHIIYNGRISGLLESLESRVRWHLENSGARSEPIADALAFYAAGVPLVDGSEVEVWLHPETRVATVRLDYGVTNASNFVYRAKGEDIGLLVPRGIIITEADDDASISRVALPDGRTLYTFGPLEDLLPQAWSTIRLQLVIRNGSVLAGQHFALVSRHFTEFGPRDIAFTMSCVAGRKAAIKNVAQYTPLYVSQEDVGQAPSQ